MLRQPRPDPPHQAGAKPGHHAGVDQPDRAQQTYSEETQYGIADAPQQGKLWSAPSHEFSA
jgi:hypothetical protein